MKMKKKSSEMGIFNFPHKIEFLRQGEATDNLI